MSGTVQTVEGKLNASLEPQHLEVTDLSDGCGAKIHILVVSKKFDGKSLVDRQRMVNEALKAEIPSIHAITMKTQTPEQWEKTKQQQQ